ncbi:MAG TPA: hypothetical protein VGS41_00350 [Chthonomonadales bacterium]|nr:hypothetical protein [Chthonomonadales bacterium]
MMTAEHQSRDSRRHAILAGAITHELEHARRMNQRTHGSPSSDADAEARLPFGSPLRRQYQNYRASGYSPEEAFLMTERDWRELIHESAFVPSREIDEPPGLISQSHTHRN